MTQFKVSLSALDLSRLRHKKKGPEEIRAFVIQVEAGLVIHAAHTAAGQSWGSAVLYRPFGDHGFRCDQKLGDRRGILRRRPNVPLETRFTHAPHWPECRRAHVVDGSTEPRRGLAVAAEADGDCDAMRRPESRRYRQPSGEKYYFCWALLALAVLECWSAFCACCWAWVACSLPLAWSFLL
jgi:hypothetical protein